MILYTFNGLIVLIVGLLGGYFQGKAIKTNNGKEQAWRVVHSGGCQAGIMLIVIGFALKQLLLSQIEQITFNSFLLLGTYTLIIGMVIAAISGKRGILRNQSNTTGKCVRLLYIIGAIGSLSSMGYLLIRVGIQLFT